MIEQNDEATGLELDAWTLFQTRLAAYLSTMVDPSDTDRLTLLVPGGDDRPSGTIAVSTFDAGAAIRADMAGDYTCREISDTADLARAITEVISFRYALPHPGLVTVAAEGPAAPGVGILGLASDSAVHSDSITEDTDEDRRVMFPSGRDELLAQVLAHLRATIDEDLEADSDEDIPIVVDGIGMWVCVPHGEPMIKLFSPAVLKIVSRRQAGIELNILNRDHGLTRWIRRDRTIWQELLVPAYPFSLLVLDEVVRIFAVNGNQVRHDLADRLGGQALSA